MKKQLGFLFIFLLISHEYIVVAESQQYQFVAEVGRLMDIIINSLYTQKQIFLRELISNASDAIDKIRFQAISNPDILGTQTELEIKIKFDAKQKTLEVIDNGVGMTRSDLITNLGTIAKSGTTNFLKNLKKSDVNLIGQFGVGFYSSFLVGAKVEVISKHNDDKQYKWISTAANSFTIEDDNSIELKRGTIVKIYLKEDATEFCDYPKLQKLIKRYSSFINYPIYLQKEKQVQERVEKTEEEIEEEKQKIIEEWKEKEKEIDQEEIQNSINRTIIKKKKELKFERMNQNKPLWKRRKEKIQKSEYIDFHKLVFKDNNPALSWSHFKAEGDVYFTGLLFVPERPDPTQSENFHSRKATVKLYVRRVLINDDFEGLMPRYLSFINAIVDSDSLSLSVNRENLQDKKMLKAIGNKLTSKAIDTLMQFNPDPSQENELFSEDEDAKDYEGFESAFDKKVDIFNKFWKNFGKNLKYGMIEDQKNREKLAKLTRWYTTHNASKLTSLDEYIERMKPDQKYIYFLGGQNRFTLQYSPMIQKLVKQGYQVVLGDDSLDQNSFNTMRDYKSKTIKNVARSDYRQPYKTDQMRKQGKFMKKVYQPLIDYLKKQLNQHLKDVRISHRLVENPVVIIADQNSNTPNKERIQAATSMKSSVFSNRNQKKIMEINPHSPTIQALNKIVTDQPDQDSAQLVHNLYYSALIHSGFQVKNPFIFSDSVFSMINTAFGIKNQISPIKVTDEDLATLEQPAFQEQSKEDEEDKNVVNLDEEEEEEEKNQVNSQKQPEGQKVQQEQGKEEDKSNDQRKSTHEIGQNQQL